MLFHRFVSEGLSTSGNPSCIMIKKEANNFNGTSALPAQSPKIALSPANGN